MAKIKVSAALSFHLEALRENPLSSIFMLQNSILCSHRIEFPFFLFAWPLHLHVSNGASNSFSALNLWLPFLLLASEKLSAFTEFMVRSGPPG